MGETITVITDTSDTAPVRQSSTKPHTIAPAAPVQAPLTRYAWHELEMAYMLALLEENRWNISRAARLAGLNRSTFNSRLRRLGIKKSG